MSLWGSDWRKPSTDPFWLIMCSDHSVPQAPFLTLGGERGADAARFTVGIPHGDCPPLLQEWIPSLPTLSSHHKQQADAGCNICGALRESSHLPLWWVWLC